MALNEQLASLTPQITSHTITMLTACRIRRLNSTSANLHPKPFDLNPNPKIQKYNVCFETKGSNQST